jgi:hypothetical protein
MKKQADIVDLTFTSQHLLHHLILFIKQVYDSINLMLIHLSSNKKSFAIAYSMLAAKLKICIINSSSSTTGGTMVFSLPPSSSKPTLPNEQGSSLIDSTHLNLYEF